MKVSVLRSRWAVMILGLIAAVGCGAGVSGCLALAVPSLAYQGYKYMEKPKASAAAQPHSGSSSVNHNSSSSSDVE